MRLRRGALRGQRGSVSAELVITMPVLLLMVLAVVQFALWQHATHVAQAVAQQALAAGRVEGGSQQAALSEGDSALSQLGSGTLVGPKVIVTTGAATMSVVVSGMAEGVLPFIKLPVHAVASGPPERFTTGAQQMSGPGTPLGAGP